MIGVGFTLQPDDEFLERTARVARSADYLELTPETTWFAQGEPSTESTLVPNAFHARFLAAARAWRKPVVAHGVGFSMQTDDPDDAPRTRAWLARMREDHALFEFAWWTDHLGATSLAGEHTALPMPMPYDERSLAALRARLDAMAEIVPDAGVENTVVHFTLGDPLDEPRFLARTLDRPGRHLVLDLHNLHTMATNLRFDPHAWLARAPLHRVIELHVSGGSESPARWLPSGRSVRLDGHDGAVPEEVWALLDAVLPRCPSARGVTLERMEGTVRDAATARLLEEELDRARRAIAGARR